MIVGVKKVVWNIRLKGWSYVKNYAGIAAFASVAWGSAWLGIYKTRKTLNAVVTGRALERERSGAPEYLYYNDPAHEQTLLQLFQDKGWSIWPHVGKWARRWRRAVWRRLMQVARYGDTLDRSRALHHLMHLRYLKDWEVWWISQRLDGRAAVELARMGAGPRLLGAPPLPASLRSMPPRTPLAVLAQLHPDHQCLATFLQRNADPHQDVQQLMDTEGSGRRVPDPEEELLAALQAALHHLAGEGGKETGAVEFACSGGLALLSRAAAAPEREAQLVAARLLVCLSPHTQLLPLMHRAGLIKHLSAWLEGEDGELSCLAGGALSGLAGAGHYGPAVQLLYPTHRTDAPPRLDVVTVHGLLGEPFVTWRQRDVEEDEKKVPVSIIPDDDDEERQYDHEYEFVLRDLPESAERDASDVMLSNRGQRSWGKQEQQELNERTRCWPRDWLPRDCPNIRVLGVSYDTVMTEWGAGECAADTGGGGLEQRARGLSEALRRAGVGQRPILWAAHSMGGLLVKQMLVHSLQSEDKNEKTLAANTWGVMFYSTPHHGTRAAHALLWPSREVQDLREDSSTLKRLHRAWLEGGWRCVCLAEGRRTRLLPGLPHMLLVPPASADAGVGPFYTLPLNHLDICKPATRHSFIYRQMVEMVQHATGERCRPQGCSICSVSCPEETNIFVALYQRLFRKAPWTKIHTNPDDTSK